MKLSNEKKGEEDDDPSDVLKAVLEAVSGVSCKVKLMVVADHAMWAAYWGKTRNDKLMKELWEGWKEQIRLEGWEMQCKIGCHQKELVS